MADDLKRVGLVFKEDGAVDFRKSLQLVNAELRENYNQFKLTQTQWDNSTKKTTKLKDELQYLSNAYEIQEGKVETLRMQLKELEGDENKDTVAIQKKRAELTKAEISLQNYKNKIEDVSKQLKITGEDITKFGENISKVGEKIENVGKKISVFSTATAGAFVASAKTAIDFEDAFTGVEKTVNATDEQLEEMKGQIRELAKEMPASTTEIAAVAEAAGQLGIKTENIMSFSKAMLDLGNSTNLTSDEAASSLAKFANVTQMSQGNFDRLGATIVDLGNNFATTEADIVAMAMRVAGAGKQVGMSEAEIMGFATALSSVGIEAEMGGSALSKAMVKMQNAVETGGGKLNTILKKTGKSLKDLELMSANNSKDFKALSQSIGMTSTELKQFITAGTNLEDFAKVSGMTVEQFKKAWKEDATGALSAFIKGLGDAESKGDSAIAMLTEMGLTEVRLRDSLLRAANAGNLFNDAIETGRKAWEDNTALTNEANKRYDTLKSKLAIATNKIKDMGITLGNKLMPYVEKAVNWVDKLVKRFDGLNDEQLDTIVNIGKVVIAIGPAITIIGKLISGLGTATKAIGTVKTALDVVKGVTTSTSTAVNGLATVFSIINPVALIAVAGITALSVATYKYAQNQNSAMKEAEEFTQKVTDSKQALDDYNKSIEDSANAEVSHIEYVSKLKDKLIQLADENGKVKEGYEGRVSFILNELNKALGTEYSLNGDVINSYQNLRDEIDKTIEKKKAEILLNAEEEEEYKNAIENQTEAVKQLNEAQNNLGMSYDTAKQKVQDWKDAMHEAVQNQDSDAVSSLSIQGKQIEVLEEKMKAYETAESTVKTYTDKVKQYETDYASFVEGNYEQIGQSIINTTKTWSDSSVDVIKKSIETQSKELKQYKEIYERTGNEVANQSMQQAQKNLQNLANELVSRTTTIGTLGEDEIKAWQTLAMQSNEVYSQEIYKMSPEMQEEIQRVTGIIAGNTTIQYENGMMAQRGTSDFAKNNKISVKMQEEINATANVLNSDTSIKAGGEREAGEVNTGFNRNVDGHKWGSDLVENIVGGLTGSSALGKLAGAASRVAGTIASYIHHSVPDEGPLADELEYMPDMIDNLVKTLYKASPKLEKATSDVAGMVSDNLSDIDADLDISNSNNVRRVNYSNAIDYNKLSTTLTNAFLTALNKCKLTLDEDGFARIVKDELYKVI